MPAVLQVEAQALGRRQVVFGDLVQARQVLDQPVAQHEAAPEIASGAVDEEQRALVVHQQVAPLQVVVGEMVIMHHPGMPCQLATDVVDPGAVMQARVIALGQGRKVFGTRQLTGDHRPAAKGQAIALQAPGDHIGGGDAPLLELLEVLPFGLDPWPAQVAAHVLACSGITFDVVVDPITLDADDLAERVAGQALALQGEHRVETAEVRRQMLVARRQCPTRHQSASP